MTVETVLPIPVDGQFTYLVPANIAPGVRPGCRVVVPFGKRTMTATIVSVGNKEGTWKEVVDVLDENPVLSDEMLALTRWIADYYVCSWGDAIRAALPSGIDVTSKQRLFPTERVASEIDEADRAVIFFLMEHPGTTIHQVQRALGPEANSSRMRRLHENGLIRIDQTLEHPKVTIRTAKHVALAEHHDWDDIESATELAPGTKQQAVLHSLLSDRQQGIAEVKQADLLKATGATASTIQSLVRKGLVQVADREMIRTPLGDLVVHASQDARPKLNEGQEVALDALKHAIQADAYQPFLLHGVTGSGKTEVYLQALERVLSMGKSGIVLVPEISLTPQTVHRFRSRLGETVQVMHSRMSAGERYDAWRLLHSGRSRVVVGPRSAVLAPLSNLGLLIVDEEHETSYKQFDPAPRYHARDVAVYRARLNNAVCLLGSATPSLESYRNAQTGKYTLLEMPDRVPVADSVATLPEVHVVDLGLERKKHRLDGFLSEQLRAAIDTRLERGEQTILLQNRRGYAGVLECPDCGWSPECKDCAVTMTVHKRARQLRCHYCGLATRLPDLCPECGGDALAPHGAGTQRIEEELEALFPAARLLRMDFDTTRSRDAHRKILDLFRLGKADILVGTQMVAKGLDFERVTLVGVVNADTGLLFPDFRSAERSFQMLTQVAGRAGRSTLKGEVILQTRRPEHPVIELASSHDFSGFVASEMPQRGALGYPPFGRLIGLEFQGHKDGPVRRLAHTWTDALRHSLRVPILGPEAAFIARVKRQYRYQTLIKLRHDTSPTTVKHTIRALFDSMGRPSGNLRIVIDIDPFGLF